MYRLVSETLPADGLDSYERESARVMTAMTFDEHGEPIDYFKQVFTAFEIAENLAREGINVDVSVLIADHFVSHNQIRCEQGLNAETIERCAANRRATLEALADLYAEGLEVDIKFTSELRDKTYDRIVERLGERVESDPIFKKLLLRSVPEHRQNPQLSARENTRYTRGELATIIRSGTDIKVGPRRERLYDAAARDSSVREVAPNEYPRIVGAYVTDSYPTDVATETLEQLRQDDALLPYKAKSRGFEPTQHRIMLCDNPETLQRKVKQAPPELQSDLELLASFMNDSDLDVSESLVREFDTIRSIAGFDEQLQNKAKINPSGLRSDQVRTQ